MIRLSQGVYPGLYYLLQKKTDRRFRMLFPLSSLRFAGLSIPLWAASLVCAYSHAVLMSVLLAGFIVYLVYQRLLTLGYSGWKLFPLVIICTLVKIGYVVLLFSSTPFSRKLLAHYQSLPEPEQMRFDLHVYRQSLED